MPLTISTTYASLVSLTSTAQNPTTITNSARLKAGLKVSVNGLTVTNAGTVEPNPTLGSGAGIYLAGTSDIVINQSGGTILGNRGIVGSGAPISASDLSTVVNFGIIAGNATSVSDGMLMFEGGVVTNQSSGTVSGFYGIAFSEQVQPVQLPEIVVNGGLIAGDATKGVGIALGGGGTVTNRSGGTISGLKALSAQGGPSGNPSTVVNAGIIAGNASSTTFWSVGVGLNAGGFITNQSSGRISGDRGIYIAGGTILNAGSIVGYSSVSISSSKLGIALYGVSVVTNQSGGYIGGAIAITGVSGTETVVNAGTIAGSNATTSGQGVQLNAGTLTNQSGGTIEGFIAVTAFAAATIFNAGSIAGNLTAASGRGIYLSTTGSVANLSGGWIGGNDAVRFNSTATFTNAGTIAGNATLGTGIGLFLFRGGSATNKSGAIITGYQAVVSSYAPVFNYGTIAGNTTRGIGAQVGGGLTNESIGIITGKVGVSGAGQAIVANAGSITGNTTNGTGIVLTGGTVTNQLSGSVSGFTGIGGGTNVVGGVVVVNAGDITGSMNGGFGINNVYNITNQSSGTIAGYDGVKYGNVLNAGLITGNTVAGAGVAISGQRVTNQSSGTIAGFYGATLSGQGSIVNAGRIAGNTAGGTGIVLGHGGLVTNQSNGSIDGYNGIHGSQFYRNFTYYGSQHITIRQPTIANAGRITANMTAGTGIILIQGGSVVNQSGGSISGFVGIDGGKFSYTSASRTNAIYNYSSHSYTYVFYPGTLVVLRPSLTNAGSIIGNMTTGTGVVLTGGGTIVNQSGGLIAGYRGIAASGGPTTVVNAGSIAGASSAIALTGGYANRLIRSPGAAIAGTVSGGNTFGSTVQSTLELVSAASAGSISGLGTRYIDFAQTTIDSGATWSFTGTNLLGAGYTLTNAGTLINTGTLTLFDATLTGGGIVNNGGIILDPSTMVVASLTGTGSVTSASGSTLEVQGTVSSGETIVFGGAGAYLHIDTPSSFAGRILDFAGSETIDLKGVSPGSVSYTIGSGVLQEGGGTIALSTTPEVPLSATASADGSSVATLCFCVDTYIRTPYGDRRVQDLQVGDIVSTFGGGVRPIVWIGLGKVLATPGRRGAATPAIVRKGALAPNVPGRDLHLTKGHALYLDDVLIPVEFLINHRSIVWDDRAREVELYHIELDAHDVLIADGAPAESYRDDGNRWLFRNSNSGWNLPPLTHFAPVLTGGPVVDAAWRRILDRAGPRPGLPLTEDPDLHLSVNGRRIDAVSCAAGAYAFELPTGVSEVRIVSRAGSPAELGLARDPRRLGVALRWMVLRQGTITRSLDIASELLHQGVHAFEADNKFRWTDGDALLPAGWFAGLSGAFSLALRITAMANYPLEGTRIAA